MSTVGETNPQDLALARIRVALSDIAPEIPEDEIVPESHLLEDLQLDEVSVWALATNVESLARVRLKDADILTCEKVSDLMALIVGDDDSSAKKDDAAESSNDVMAAASDLANLFNN